MFLKIIYCCDGKAEFSTLFLQPSVSHDPSEIMIISWFGAKKKLLIIWW